jgi:hypothetical protein
MAASRTCTTLLVLLLSCGTLQPPVAPSLPSPCVIPQLTPPPPLDSAHECSGEVCISWPESIALSRWIRQVGETRVALEGCSLVQLVP